MGPRSMKDTSPVPIEDKDLDLTFSLLDARHTGATPELTRGESRFHELTGKLTSKVNLLN